MMMKKIFIVFSLFFLFFSCSNNQEIVKENYYTKTIKSVVKSKEEVENWTEEIEPERLSKKLIAENEIVLENLNLSSDLYKILCDYKSPVYPSLQNFTNLDISLIDLKTLSKLQDFCNFISEGILSSLNSFFYDDYKFNSIFFINNLKSIYQKNFYENQFDGTQELFKKYFIGKPFFTSDENFMQIPLCFENDKGKMYFEVLVNPNKDKIIYQVTISQWELKNEK